MADLPEEGLEASTAFADGGVDYFGPFIVKIGRRNEKRWCCLFTGPTMRAVHIEVVPKLDSDQVPSSVTMGQISLELKENLHSMLQHGT